MNSLMAWELLKGQTEVYAYDERDRKGAAELCTVSLPSQVSLHSKCPTSSFIATKTC